MTGKTIEEIELKTRDILEQVVGDITSIDPPVDLAQILKYYNLKLAMAGFKDPQVAGAFDDSTKTIYLLKNDSSKRQMFTVAHELGHILLGHKKKFDIFYRHQATEFNGTDAQEEKAANFFAASLLMPKELVIKLWNKYQDIELFAAYFGVSRSAAFWRLKNLGLI